MRETLATARNRLTYIAHARQHVERIKLSLRKVQARADAQRRRSSKEAGKTGAIARLEQYKEILPQYQKEIALWDSMMAGENVRSLEAPGVVERLVNRPPQWPTSEPTAKSGEGK